MVLRVLCSVSIKKDILLCVWVGDPNLLQHAALLYRLGGLEHFLHKGGFSGSDLSLRRVRMSVRCQAKVHLLGVYVGLFSHPLEVIYTEYWNTKY